ncbi:hypothetical protein [Planomonospora algeriensis]
MPTPRDPLPRYRRRPSCKVESGLAATVVQERVLRAGDGFFRYGECHGAPHAEHVRLAWEFRVASRYGVAHPSEGHPGSGK